MDGQSAFRALTAGVRFNKKKLAKQIEPFNPQPSTSKVTIEDVSAVAGLPESNKTKKRKRAAIEAEADEEVDSSAVRRTLRIRCTGSDIPNVWQDFERFPNLPSDVLQNLKAMQVNAPTPIQMQASSIIHEQRDLLACAPTGSGKTLAFLLPLLLRSLSNTRPASESKETPKAVVLEPTRELARQVYTEAGKIKRGMDWQVRLLGDDRDGESDEESQSATSGLLITTPLRLVYAVKQGEVDLSHVEYLVLDEADRLFELGFISQTDEIIAACSNSSLRKAMFSATIPSGVEELAKSVMGSDMIRVIIGGSDSATSLITQDLLYSGSEDGKLVALKNLIRSGGLTPPALIFVQSVDRAKDLNKELQAYNVKCDAMHAERSKEDRDALVQRFADGKLWVLVCTDVMSRGVDFRGVELVINYDFPQSVQSYIHRIGRTGRAGRTGKAVTLFTRADASYLRSIVNVMRNSGCEVPAWMLSLPAPSQKEKKKLRRKPVERKDVSRSTGSVGGGKGSRKKPADSKLSRASKRAKQDASKSDDQSSASDSE